MGLGIPALNVHLVRNNSSDHLNFNKMFVSMLARVMQGVKTCSSASFTSSLLIPRSAFLSLFNLPEHQHWAVCSKCLKENKLLTFWLGNFCGLDSVFGDRCKAFDCFAVVVPRKIILTWESSRFAKVQIYPFEGKSSYRCYFWSLGPYRGYGMPSF